MHRLAYTNALVLSSSSFNPQLCPTQLLELTPGIGLALDNGAQIDCTHVMLDFLKAFNNVTVCFLMHDLPALGIPKDFLGWLAERWESMYGVE